MAKVITVASGKGGVGKTSISLNLSLSLSRAGFRVCLFDADLGLANVNILTGLYPDKGLAEVLAGQCALFEIMIRDFHGIDIIPGSTGVEKLADLSGAEANALVREFLELPAYDYFIIDTSAGISSQVLAFCRASQEMVLVATPEPTSLTDAYSLVKVLSRTAPMPRVRVVVNQVGTAAAAKQAYAKLKKTVHKFLSISIAPLGIVARDANVPIAVVSQIPFFILFPDTKASRCIRSIALKLVKDSGTEEDVPVEAFWDNCLALLAGSRENRASAGPDAGEFPDAPEADDLPAAAPALENRLAQIESMMAALLEEVAQIKTMLAAPPSENRQKRGASPVSRPGATASEPAAWPVLPDPVPTVPAPPSAPAPAADMADPMAGVPAGKANDGWGDLPDLPLPASGRNRAESNDIPLDFEAWLAGRRA